MKLYLKELKKVMINIIYVIFIVILVVKWNDNFRGLTSEQTNVNSLSTQSILRKPEETDTYFGTKTKEVPDKIMCGATDLLIMEYKKNTYATYPYSYYKGVSLNQKEQLKILEFIKEITGLDEYEINNLKDYYFPKINGNIMHPNGYEVDEEGNVIIPEEVSDYEVFSSHVDYNRFKEITKELCKMIGKGSLYSTKYLLLYYGNVNMTYEEAMIEYNKTISSDKITRGFARLFCDYMDLFVSLYSIFIVVVLFLKDRRNKLNEIIYTKTISSRKLIIARYFAVVTAIILPIIILSFESLIPLINYSIKTKIIIDVFAFIEYILWWTLPTILIVTALGMFITIITDSLIAIVIQLVWYFFASSLTGLENDYSIFSLMIRHNTLNGRDFIMDNLNTIILNRVLLVIVSICLIILSIIIYNKKRIGKLNMGDLYEKCFRAIQKKFSTH